MTTWLTALVAVASVLFGGGGLAVLVGAFTGRHGRRVEVAARLSDSSLQWVQEFQEEAARARVDAAEARVESSEARREMAEIRREMASVRREAESLLHHLRSLHGAILAPNASLERLRAMVGGATSSGLL